MFEKSAKQRRSNVASIQSRRSAGSGTTTYPPSFAQQRLWFLDQYESNSGNYNLSAGWRLKGPIDDDALQWALNTIVERHETLRTSFTVENGEPKQVVAPQISLELPLIDLSTVEPQKREQKALELAAEEAQRPFDLTRAPLLRCKLLRLDEQHHMLLLTIHHIVSDGWSQGLLAHELQVLYDIRHRRLDSPLSPLEKQYTDYALWQRHWLQGKVLHEQLKYWKAHLQGAPALLELPLDHPRPAIQSYQGAECVIVLPPELIQALKALALANEATLFMVLLAAFKVLLKRCSGQDDIVVGTPIAGRNREEFENLIGFFVNTLALRCDLSGNPDFTQLLDQVREVTLDAYDHQDLPFERLVEELQPDRSLSHTPLFQVMFSLQNAPQIPLRFPEVDATPLGIRNPVADFDLIMDVDETDQGHRVCLIYSTALFDADTIHRLLNHYRVLLEGIASEPQRPLSDLPMLTDRERHQILVEWNATATRYHDQACIHELFEQQVAQSPDSVAIVFEGRELTYAQLNAKANQLARYLRTLGIKPDNLVGIFMERSPEMVIAIYGVLKAGGAYVPLDPNHPDHRVAYMLADTRADVVLTQARLAANLPAGSAQVINLDSDWQAIDAAPTHNLGRSAAAENLAYVMYTSGSTGRPKGVMIPHRAVLNQIHWVHSNCNLTASDTVLQRTAFSFDPSVGEIFGSLLAGARLIIPRPGTKHDTDYLAGLIAAHNITVIDLVPSLLAILLDEPGFEKCGSLRTVFCGGEALSIDLADRYCAKMKARLINAYGPTEACINATFWPCDPNHGLRTVPIGKPVSNTKTYLLDDHLNPVPIGIVGELYIGGESLARGYLNQPELTAERFVNDPFSREPGARIYKTGDLARYLPDGNIEYLGRNDFQVKLSGIRIELGEIETALQQHPEVREAVVLARETNPGANRLLAYFVPERQDPPSSVQLREFLKQHLPSYMLPSLYVPLDALPLTPNGKIDRKALPIPQHDETEDRQDLIAPTSNLELQLVKIWENYLNRRPIGVEDNFFELGGYSLLAVRVIAEINKITGQHLSVAVLFQAPTIRRLAAIINTKNWSPQYQWLVPIQPYGEKTPYFQIHGTVNVVHHLHPDQPFYQLDFYGTDGGQRPVFKTVEEIAANYLKEIKMVQPKGPYLLGGFCFGGLVAIEMAHQLIREGESIPLLFLIDPSIPFKNRRKKSSARGFTRYGIRAALKARINSLCVQAKDLMSKAFLALGRPLPQALRRGYISDLYGKAMKKYISVSYSGPVILNFGEGQQDVGYWKRFFLGKVEVHYDDGQHMSLLEDPALVQQWGERLAAGLDGINAKM